MPSASEYGSAPVPCRQFPDFHAAHCFNLISYGTEGDSIAGVQYLTCVLASLNYLTAVPAQEEINEQLNSDIGHALKYIEQNIENPITLQELAQASNYSLSRFKAKFKEELGITPAEYITPPENGSGTDASEDYR